MGVRAPALEAEAAQPAPLQAPSDVVRAARQGRALGRTQLPTLLPRNRLPRARAQGHAAGGRHEPPRHCPPGPPARRLQVPAARAAGTSRPAAETPGAPAAGLGLRALRGPAGGGAGPAGGVGAAPRLLAAAEGSFQEVAILDPFSRSRRAERVPQPARPRRGPAALPARPPAPAELAMAATDLERFPVRAGLAGARAGVGGAGRGEGPPCSCRGAGRAVSAARRAPRSVGRGSRGVGGVAPGGAGAAGPFRGKEPVPTECRPGPRGREGGIPDAPHPRVPGHFSLRCWGRILASQVLMDGHHR